jgi:hypothetical protein
MSHDHFLPRRVLLGFGLVLGVGTGVPFTAHGQASVVSALAGVSLVPGTGTGLAGAGLAVRVGETAPAGGRDAEGGVTSLTGAEAAAMVQRERGRATAVILYGTNCPRSQAMFPGLVALAARHAGRNPSFLAFATDRRAQDVPPFLAHFGAPFQPYYIKPRQAGEMGRDMATIGLHLPSPWNLPHIAVLDANGQVVGEWDGATDLNAIDAALSSVP